MLRISRNSRKLKKKKHSTFAPCYILHSTKGRCLQVDQSYLVSFFAALLVELDQLVLAWARLDPQVEAGKEYYQMSKLVG